jgi:hypothetical protein
LHQATDVEEFANPKHLARSIEFANPKHLARSIEFANPKHLARSMPRLADTRLARRGRMCQLVLEAQPSAYGPSMWA